VPHDFLVGGVVGEVADEVVDPGCSEHVLTKGFVVAAEVGLSREWVGGGWGSDSVDFGPVCGMR
jgi:hypothetical protein